MGKTPPNSNGRRIPGTLGCTPVHAHLYTLTHTLGHPRAFSRTRYEERKGGKIPTFGKEKGPESRLDSGACPRRSYSERHPSRNPPLSLHPRDTQERQKYETQMNPTARCLLNPGHFPAYVTRESWKGLRDRLVRWLKAAASAVTREAPRRYRPGSLPRNSEPVVGRPGTSVSKFLTASPVRPGSRTRLMGLRGEEGFAPGPTGDKSTALPLGSACQDSCCGVGRITASAPCGEDERDN